MDFIELVKAFILGVVQGITEWLPISSTGHMIIVEDFLKFNLPETFINTFFVVVQIGSVLAVVVLFFNQLNPFSKDKNNTEKKETINLWFKIIIATIPAVLIGYFFSDQIDKWLYNSIVVALALIIYGVIFIIIENQTRAPKISNILNIPFKTAINIGLFQVLALIPGTSRSGSTIIGSMLLGTSRFIASEFSFFLAIPTLLGASFYKILKLGFNFSPLELSVLLVGSFTAFIVSMFVIKFLLDYIRKHNFKVFGYYRIALGIIILLYFGIKLLL